MHEIPARGTLVTGGALLDPVVILFLMMAELALQARLLVLHVGHFHRAHEIVGPLDSSRDIAIGNGRIDVGDGNHVGFLGIDRGGTVAGKECNGGTDRAQEKRFF